MNTLKNNRVPIRYHAYKVKPEKTKAQKCMKRLKILKNRVRKLRIPNQLSKNLR